MGGFIDIEDALQTALNEAGFSAHAKPLPAGFETPCVTVWMVNAQPVNAAQVEYRVEFDCRADADAEAMALMLSVADWVRGLSGKAVGGAACFASDEPLLQGAQNDASHPSCVLATVSATLLLRVAD